MKPPTEIPDGLLPVPYGKGRILRLTERVYVAGIRDRNGFGDFDKRHCEHA